MERFASFSPAQYEVLNTISCLTSEEDVRSLKDILVQFLNTRLQKELNRLWDNNILSQETIDSMANEHLRTPYK